MIRKFLLATFLTVCLTTLTQAQTIDEGSMKKAAGWVASLQLNDNDKESRLMAIDYKNMKEISAIFEIFKTKNEQYFTNSGRDWRTIYRDYVQRIKQNKKK